jgi:hypothetical protein
MATVRSNTLNIHAFYCAEGISGTINQTITAKLVMSVKLFLKAS